MSARADRDRQSLVLAQDLAGHIADNPAARRQDVLALCAWVLSLETATAAAAEGSDR